MNAAEEALETETPPCPVCDEVENGIVVGTRARFGMAVRTLSCRTCGMVYTSPRPTPAAMDAYYRGPYQKQYRNVKLVTADGAPVAPGETGYAEASEARFVQQTQRALEMGSAKRGDTVLEVGCRDGETLARMRDIAGIVPHGVEPSPKQVANARERGIDCFEGLLEEFQPGEKRFKQVQMFHVLEHLHNPLAAVIRLRALLEPGGTLLLEVPNVYAPYGLLEENFFQNAHLHNFSPDTLSALCARAGLKVVRISVEPWLMVAAQRTNETALPLRFDASMLPEPEHRGEWVAAHLEVYKRTEIVRAQIQQKGPSVQLVQTLATLVRKPSFPNHLGNTVASVVTLLANKKQFELAYLVAGAAATGPHDPRLVEGFKQLAVLMRNKLVQQASR